MKVYYVVIARIHAPRVEISCVTYSRGNSRCKILWWVVREMSISRTKRLRRNEGCQKERAARETIQPPTRYVITRGKAIDRSTDKYSISNWRATDTSSLAHTIRGYSITPHYCCDRRPTVYRWVSQEGVCARERTFIRANGLAFSHRCRRCVGVARFPAVEKPFTVLLLDIDALLL